MNKDENIMFIIDNLKKELKKCKDKQEKLKIKQKIKGIRVKYHISLYDYLKWKRDKKNESSNIL